VTERALYKVRKGAGEQVGVDLDRTEKRNLRPQRHRERLCLGDIGLEHAEYERIEIDRGTLRDEATIVTARDVEEVGDRPKQLRARDAALGERAPGIAARGLLSS
jgi:hypothetical protein